MGIGPIFLGGLERSGKTYMRFMLDSHPDIAFSKRTDLWSRFYNRYGDLSQSDNFERCLSALLSRKHIAHLNPDPEWIRAKFRQGAPTYPRLFALLHERYAESQGKVRWGDQTEFIEFYAPAIFSAYPDAKMIHMLRDPRDRYAAMLDRPTRRKGGVGKATAQWLYSARLARQNQRQYPQRYMVIQYEAMVSQPDEIMQKVCSFLEEAYIPAILSMPGEDRFDHVQGEAQELEASPLTTAFIGTYKNKLSSVEIAFIERRARKEMAALHYQPGSVHLSLSEALRLYCIDWPVNLGSMIAWQSRLVFQHQSL